MLDEHRPGPSDCQGRPYRGHLAVHHMAAAPSDERSFSTVMAIVLTAGRFSCSGGSRRPWRRSSRERIHTRRTASSPAGGFVSGRRWSEATLPTRCGPGMSDPHGPTRAVGAATIRNTVSGDLEHRDGGMNPIAQHLDEIRRSYHGNAWHGPSLREALADVSAAEAAQRPIDAHSIWEITLHVTAWIEEVTGRLRGGSPSTPERGDWPIIADTAETSWAEALSALGSAQHALEEAIERFPPEHLASLVGGPVRDAPLGTGVSFSSMLDGLAQHNAYHAGQIALLKRAVRSVGPRESPVRV